MAGKLFLSYSHKDVAEADLLFDELGGRGLDIWQDNRSLAGGEVWTDKITEAIIAAGAVILLASQAALDSRHVRREVHLACDEEKFLLPIVLEQCSFPAWARYLLAGLQNIHVSRGELVRQVDEIHRALDAMAGTGSDETLGGADGAAGPTRDNGAAGEEGGASGARLILLREGKFLEEVTLTGEVISIGRHSSCDVVPPRHVTKADWQENKNEIVRMSRHHAYLRRAQDKYLLNDVSTCGTLLNGRKVQDVEELKDGDVIGMGLFQVVFMQALRGDV
jgi:hypothetical protein